MEGVGAGLVGFVETFGRVDGDDVGLGDGNNPRRFSFPLSNVGFTVGRTDGRLVGLKEVGDLDGTNDGVEGNLDGGDDGDALGILVGFMIFDALGH